ncbi:MAG TPA: hypothetical protein VN872_09410 [Candidatus Acidoferrum sp.]|nr:hypothetical protein [Candidatus Acidoferrum sp.]
MSLATFTLIHVIISLVGIGAGLVVLFGMLGGRRLDGMTALFLATTVLTSVTGFGFPFAHVTPGIILGILSLVVLAIAIVARYSFRMAGRWRSIYVVTAVIALYFNCFVLIAQSFQKVPALHALAPKGNEPPFAIAQGILLVLFIVAGVLAVKKFRPDAATSLARAASGVKS